jgi:hypothetical protein
MRRFGESPPLQADCKIRHDVDQRYEEGRGEALCKISTIVEKLCRRIA